MTEKELLDLLDKPTHEHEQLEFKEAKEAYSVLGSVTNKNCIYAYCVGFGNLGGGKLLLGIKNDKTIVGTSKCNDIVNIKSQIFSKMRMRLTFNEIDTSGSKKVIVVNIPSRRSGELFKFYDIALTRVGEELVSMNDTEMKSILNEGEEDWSGQSVEKATFEDIDLEALVKAKENFIKKYPNIPKEEIESWGIEKFLESAKLLNNGKITYAALILLGKESSRNLLEPYLAQITWSLLDDENNVIDYKHFYQPFILSVDRIFNKIRNLKQRYMKEPNSLFPEEVDQYDAFVIREALHNCIAHQDYSEKDKITVVEKPEKLIFTNSGEFIPKTIERVIETDSPPRKYRNRFLAEAMVNLNMIDTVGSGIKRMFSYQRQRFFPLPTYDLENKEVKVDIFGKIIDINYARILAKDKKLSLDDIIILDRVQKGLVVERNKIVKLRRYGYIEGKYPLIHISATVAGQTHSEADYIKKRGFDNSYYEKLIVEYIKMVKTANKRAIDGLLLDKLPEVLSYEQKLKKVSNILFFMYKKGLVESVGNGRNAVWKLNISDSLNS